MLKNLLLLAILLTCTGCAELFASRAQAQNPSTESTQTAQAADSASSAPATQTSAPSAAAQSTDTTSEAQPADPVQDTPEQMAAKDLAQARTLVAQGSWKQAISMAVSSYKVFPSDEARTLITYSASQLTPIEVMHLEANAQTHIEQAIYGQLRLNACGSQKDETCIQEVLPKTVNALQMIGDSDSASRLMILNSGSSASLPLTAVLLPLSGNDRKIGRAMLGSLLQASGIYNHTPLPFSLRFFDTQTSTGSLEAILTEARRYNAKLVLGTLDVRESIAAAKNLSDQVMIGFSPNDEFLNHSENAFQFTYSLAEESQALAQFIISLNASRIAALSPDDAYTSASVEQLQSYLPQSIQIAATTWPANQTDLRDIAKKIAKSTPDVIFMPTSSDNAERIASFLAQENIWCSRPGTPAPKVSSDTRKFVTCISNSAWAPISSQHHYKFIVEAIYLDYTDAAAAVSPDFAAAFESLYHRQPAIQEVLPFMAVAMLKKLPQTAWQSADSLKAAISELLKGRSYRLIPGLRRVTEQSSQAWSMTADTVPPARTLVNSK